MYFSSKHSLCAAIALALLTCTVATVSAAPVKPVVDARPIPVDRGAAETWQMLKKLHTRASLLMIVAHPDDEDGATLAYESRGMGVRTDLMTLNRGEGGANVMSSDLWDALGLVRTEELLQAGRYYGLDGQYFSSVADYGFSKSLKEALDQWGHDRVLSDAVRVVRMVRPLVVCSVFVGGPSDGHGNHATAGLMAQEVFKAAGDPKMFPEQIKAGLLPWTPVKEYARTPFFRTSEKGSYDYANHSWGPLGVTNHITGKWESGQVSTTVAIPAGTYDNVLGLTYPQISRTGLGFQKSQNGGGDVPLPREQAGNYHRFGSHIQAGDTEESFFDGIDVSLAGIADLAGAEPPAFLKEGLKQINDSVESAIAGFSAQDPSSISATLVKGMKATDTLVTEVEKSSLNSDEKYNVLHELKAKQQQFNKAILASLGIFVEADVVPPARADGIPAEFRGTQPTFQMAVPGQNFDVSVHVFNGGKRAVEVESVALEGSSGKSWGVKPDAKAAAPTQIEPGKASDVRFAASVPADEPFTRPYFTRPGMEQAYYDLTNSAFRNQPLAPYPLQATVRFRLDGETLETANVVQVISRVPGPGILRYPMPVGPPIALAISPNAGIIPLDEKSFPVSVRVHNNVQSGAKTDVHLKLPEGWTSEPAQRPVQFTQLGEEQTVTFVIHPGTVAEKPYQVTAVADYGGKSFEEGYVTTGYTGLRPYFLYKPSIYKTTGTDVKMATAQNIGYIEGSGDDVPAALESLGVHVSFLSPQDLASADLSKFDTIVVGVRAYAVRPDLVTNNNRLLKYVEDGGVVMVQYNTPEFDHNFGPYPYSMTNDPEEVTDEKSVVTILDPQNPLFTWPNKITAKDFDGWIEERGSKFLSTWDTKYEPLLETHDEGQPPQKGGLLYARYGKGVYIYNAYAFYRQLPLGVPGAYRLFANMLSLPKNPHLHMGR
ncbi:MAG TPA: PIG-L family deacetylase [Edaphobacter sp.]|nr:PIG-L family deacetylase [Edaphobacter sp.]